MLTTLKRIRVVAESLLADTPVALLQGCRIGSAAIINEQTGCFLPGRDLGSELATFIVESERYAPRSSALANIASKVSSRALNELLRQHALDNGRAWTQDIVPLRWDPNPSVADPEQAGQLAPAARELEERYGIAFGQSQDSEFGDGVRPVRRQRCCIIASG
jgi:hypothetical protein